MSTGTMTSQIRSRSTYSNISTFEQLIKRRRAKRDDRTRARLCPLWNLLCDPDYAGRDIHRHTNKPARGGASFSGLRTPIDTGEKEGAGRPSGDPYCFA
jgi:hypothetical protein